MVEQGSKDDGSHDLPPSEEDTPLVVGVDEKGLLKLETHLAKLWDQYSELAEKEGHRIGPDATSGPPQRVWRSEWNIRGGYRFTQEIIHELLNGNEFHIVPKPDPETGMVNMIEHGTESVSRKRYGTLYNSTQIVLEVIDALGIEAPESPLTHLVLKPNFPRSIGRPEIRELPQPK